MSNDIRYCKYFKNIVDFRLTRIIRKLNSLIIILLDNQQNIQKKKKIKISLLGYGLTLVNS